VTSPLTHDVTSSVHEQYELLYCSYNSSEEKSGRLANITAVLIVTAICDSMAIVLAAVMQCELYTAREAIGYHDHTRQTQSQTVVKKRG
jgi:hypothetical protein